MSPDERAKAARFATAAVAFVRDARRNGFVVEPERAVALLARACTLGEMADHARKRAMALRGAPEAAELWALARWLLEQRGGVLRMASWEAVDTPGGPGFRRVGAGAETYVAAADGYLEPDEMDRWLRDVTDPARREKRAEEYRAVLSAVLSWLDKAS